MKNKTKPSSIYFIIFINYIMLMLGTKRDTIKHLSLHVNHR